MSHFREPVKAFHIFSLKIFEHLRYSTTHWETLGLLRVTSLFASLNRLKLNLCLPTFSEKTALGITLPGATLPFAIAAEPQNPQ